MRRIVLDTNCLLQILPARSPYHKVWTDVLCGKISLCVNTEILNEYEEILGQKMTKDIARNVVEAIARLHSTIYQEIIFFPLDVNLTEVKNLITHALDVVRFFALAR